MWAYFDTSALVKRYVDEPGRREVLQLLRRNECVTETLVAAHPIRALDAIHVASAQLFAARLSSVHRASLRGGIKRPTAVAIAESGGRVRGIVPKRYSTSTLIDSASCVPWLAAEGPLAYTPENPPDTDYFFQYSWIVPEIFDSKVHRRYHHYFGTPIRDHAKPLFEFWRQARRREVDRVHLSLGSFAENGLCAPVAVYRATLHRHGESEQWLFIQHGSYQWISSDDQPHLEEGDALLYRGIQREGTSRYPSMERDLAIRTGSRRRTSAPDRAAERTRGPWGGAELEFPELPGSVLQS